MCAAVLACSCALSGAQGNVAEPRSSLPAEVRQAVSLYQKGDFRRACPLFQRGATAYPASALIHLSLLGCAVHMRLPARIEKQRVLLGRTAGKGSKEHAIAADWLASGGYCALAAKEFELAPASQAPGAYEYSSARCYQSSGEIGNAVRAFRAALDKNPANETFSLEPAALLITTGESKEAGQVLVDAVRRHPDSVPVIAAMSLLHLDLGYPDRARIGYERALALAPESPIVWKLLGRIQAWEGHYGDAIASFEQASAAAPRDAEAYLHKGIALARMDAKPDEALAAFSRAIELDPSLLEARLEAANIYFQAKQDYRRAAAELEQVVAAMPGQVRARQLLIQAYSRAGEREKAAAQAAELKRLNTLSR